MALVYSCCFWFSLRLGGIIIGIFSLIQELLVLIACLKAYNHLTYVKDLLLHWKNSMQLIYSEAFFENIISNLDKHITLAVCLTSMYMVVCVFYIYGAFTCNSLWMPGYIIAEIVRLLLIAIGVTTWLLILKENSMDIGLLIGASVGSGFILLGMLYLWLCAANLPILINEQKRDELNATVVKLKQLVTAYQNIGHRRVDEFDSRY